MAKMTYESERALRRIERIQQLLRGQDMTAQEVADGIYMDVRRARMYLRYLLEKKMIYVKRWEKRRYEGKARWIPYYGWGNAKSAPMPGSKETSAEAQRRRYKERIARDPDAHESFLARLKAKRLKPKADPLMAWIPKKSHQQMGAQ